MANWIGMKLSSEMKFIYLYIYIHGDGLHSKGIELRDDKLKEGTEKGLIDSFSTD